MLNDENSYFKGIIKDALDDLKNKGSALVFYEEQVQAIKEVYEGNIIVKEDNGFYRLSGVKVIKEEKRGRKKK